MPKIRKICPNDDSSGGDPSNETMSSTDYESPFIKKFPPIPGEEILPSLENDYNRAKAYLMQQCLSSGDNLWDHLNEVLQKILIHRPRDIGCTFEEFSYRVRECRFKPKTDHLLDIYLPPKYYDFALKTVEILRLEGGPSFKEKTETEREIELVKEPNISEIFYYLEQGGVALPRDEIFLIAVHLKKLNITHPIEKYRFWGKILGTKNNYIVAETEVLEEELARINAEREIEEEKERIEKAEKETAELEELKLKAETELEEAKQKEIQFAAERSEAKYAELLKEAQEKGIKEKPEKLELPPWPPIPPLPRATVKKTFDVPVEPTGTGANKKIYYVCNRPGEDWIQLPDVTPQQIVVARKIKRAFTGNLEAEVNTVPAFPGKEKNLLRAQIARISAGTQISPLGYYTFNEEDEEEEEAESEIEEGKTNYIVNPDYEPVSIRDLVDTSMSFWVHHTQYILPQGRTTWWNPTAREEPGVEDEGEVEEEEAMLEKEVGPELLTPLSEDSALDAISPWSVRKTSGLLPENAVAFVRSNLWPGAFAYSFEKKFENIYIGNGQKFTGSNHSPEPMQEIQEEYPLGPEIMEIMDPTPEQEEEWRLAHEPKRDSMEEEASLHEERADDDEDEDDEEE